MQREPRWLFELVWSQAGHRAGYHLQEKKLVSKPPLHPHPIFSTKAEISFAQSVAQSWSSI